MRFFQRAAKSFALAGLMALCLMGTASAGIFGDSGLFAVCVDGSYLGYGGAGCGYINEQGEWAITPRFDAANPFMPDGTAWVQKDGRGGQPNRIGRINKNGEWVATIEYEDYWLQPIGKGIVCTIGSGTSRLINERGESTSKFDRIGTFSENGLAPATREAPYGYINRQGEWVIKPVFSEAAPFVNGLAKVTLDGRSGFIDSQGQWVAAPGEAQAAAPKKGSGGVQPEKETPGSGLSVARAPDASAYGYVDSRGEWVIKPIFSEAYAFSEGLARVRYGLWYGFIKADGTWAIPPNFAGLGDFSKDGLAYAKSPNSRLAGLINRQGEWVIGPIFEYINSAFADNGLTVAQESHNSGFVNTSGEWVIPPQFQSVGAFDAGGMAAANFEGKYGYIDINGKWLLPPFYDDAGEFGANGLAAAKQGDHWGYIDRDGKWLMESLYQHFAKAGRFGANGLALARTQHDGFYGYIRNQGWPNLWTVQPVFRNAGDFAENGLAFAQKDTLYGYINAQGQWVIEPRFRFANNFASNGLAAARGDVVMYEDYAAGYINSSGAWVIPPRYNQTGGFTPYGLAHVSVGHATDFLYFNIDVSGTPRVPVGFSPEDLPKGVLWKYEESGARTLFNAEGKALLTVERRCDEDVITNAAGKIIWPLDGIVPVCGE